MIGATAELEGQLIAAQTELEGLREIYTSNNVRVRSVQARIDEYRRQLQKLGGNTPDSVGNGTSNGESTEGQKLYPSIDSCHFSVLSGPNLYRRTKVQEAVFETLTKQYEMAKVEEAQRDSQRKGSGCGGRPGEKVVSSADGLHVFWDGFVVSSSLCMGIGPSALA